MNILTLLRNVGLVQTIQSEISKLQDINIMIDEILDIDIGLT